MQYGGINSWQTVDITDLNDQNRTEIKLTKQKVDMIPQNLQPGGIKKGLSFN